MSPAAQKRFSALNAFLWADGVNPEHTLLDYLGEFRKLNFLELAGVVGEIIELNPGIGYEKLRFVFVEHINRRIKLDDHAT